MGLNNITYYFFFSLIISIFIFFSFLIWFAMNIHRDLLCVKNYKVNTWNTYIHFVFNFKTLFTILLICLKVYFFFFSNQCVYLFLFMIEFKLYKM